MKEILTPGANDVWVVKGKGGKEQLIPYIEDVVKEIDVQAKKIVITPTRRTAFVMKIDVLTLFPEMFTGVFGHSILKRAVDMKAASFQVINFRDYADNKHGTVDDYPYGGGAGMVLKPQPLFDAVEDLKTKSESENPRVVLLCPQGARYDQKKAEEFATCDHLIFICGHYEGL